MINYKNKITIITKNVINDFNKQDYLSALDNLDKIKQLDMRMYNNVKDKLIGKFPKPIIAYN